jgi:hypothetical protein
MMHKNVNERSTTTGPEAILQKTRDLISAHAEGDPDRWFYANRYVFSRLGLDERKTKTDIKRRLLDSGAPCEACGKPFETRMDVHLHRLDGKLGYSSENCVLMHADCHRKYHAKHPEYLGEGTSRPRTAKAPKAAKTRVTVPKRLVPAAEGVLVKQSTRHENKRFAYWWDISPSLAASLESYEAVEFVKKDNGERCSVQSDALRRLLTPDRRSTRGKGNWGIKVLPGRESELAFEPAKRTGEWLFLPVTWLAEQED